MIQEVGDEQDLLATENSSASHFLLFEVAPARKQTLDPSRDSGWRVYFPSGLGRVAAIP